MFACSVTGLPWHMVPSAPVIVGVGSGGGGGGAGGISGHLNVPKYHTNPKVACIPFSLFFEGM